MRWTGFRLALGALMLSLASLTGLGVDARERPHCVRHGAAMADAWRIGGCPTRRPSWEATR